jgi:Flp pilus assembly protein TadB
LTFIVNRKFSNLIHFFDFWASASPNIANEVSFVAIASPNWSDSMLLSLFFSLFGLIIVFRMSELLIHHHFVPSTQRKNLLLIAFVGEIALEVTLKTLPIAHWIVLFALFLTPGMLFQLQEMRRRDDFERKIVSFLDSLVVRLRSGQSLKESVQELGRNCSGPSRFYFQEISSLLHFSAVDRKNSKDRLFEETLGELLDVHKTTHRSVEKLKAFRRKIKTEQEFRQKSRQVTLQVKAQASVLGILFTALVFYTLHTYALVDVQKVLCISVGLFVFGVFVCFQILRRFKWTV